jgi:adenylate kinase family enzyme
VKQQIIQKISVIGNAGSGKTTLSKVLSKIYQLPLTHVDAIQFISDAKLGMKVRAHAESIAILNEVQKQPAWIIDGYGPLDILESRLSVADKIVMIDFALWRHYFWCSKRQLKSRWSRRPELPADFNEATWSQTLKLFHTLWKVHKGMRPELLRILSREDLASKTIYIRTLQDWKRLAANGFS